MLCGIVYAATSSAAEKEIAAHIEKPIDEDDHREDAELGLADGDEGLGRPAHMEGNR